MQIKKKLLAEPLQKKNVDEYSFSRMQNTIQLWIIVSFNRHGIT